MNECAKNDEMLRHGNKKNGAIFMLLILTVKSCHTYMFLHIISLPVSMSMRPNIILLANHATWKNGLRFYFFFCSPRSIFFYSFDCLTTRFISIVKCVRIYGLSQRIDRQTDRKGCNDFFHVK